MATDVGPLINAAAADKAREHCARLEAGGATLACSSARGGGGAPGHELDTVDSVDALVQRRAEAGDYASKAGPHTFFFFHGLIHFVYFPAQLYCRCCQFVADCRWLSQNPLK